MSLINQASTEQACPCGKLGASRKPLAFAACCARYRASGRGARIHETSRFVREAGRWYYVDGDLR